MGTFTHRMDGRNPSNSRRSFLKTAGMAASSVGLLGGTGLVAGKNYRPPTGVPPGREGRTEGIPEGKYKALLRQRKRKGWDIDQWRKELAKRGANFKYQDSRIRLSKDPTRGTTARVERMNPIEERGRGSGIGTNRLFEEDAGLFLTYQSGYFDHNTHSWVPDRLNFTWSMKDRLLHDVSRPVDYATMSIDPDQYNWVGDDVEFGPWASPSDAVESSSFGFRTAKYKASWHSDRTTGRFSSWMDKSIRPISGSQTTRKIYVDYVARWKEVEITGVSVSTDGTASITFGSTNGLWRAETNAWEYEMDDGKTYKDWDPK